MAQCYKNATWDNRTVPASAARVDVTAGAVTSGVNARLQTGGAVTGRIADATDQSGPTRAQVYLFDSAGQSTAYISIGDTYAFSGVAPGSYTVCTSSQYAEGASPTGYVGECYAHVAWVGAALPTAMRLVTVTAGVTTTVNITVTRAGGISGRVTDTTGAPLSGVYADVYRAGSYVGSTTTAADGTYREGGLAAGKYTVCFDASVAGGGTSPGYRSECYQNVPWDGGAAALPRGITAVAVKNAAITAQVDVQLAAAAAQS